MGKKAFTTFFLCAFHFLVENVLITYKIKPHNSQSEDYRGQSLLI